MTNLEIKSSKNVIITTEIESMLTSLVEANLIKLIDKRLTIFLLGHLTDSNIDEVEIKKLTMIYLLLSLNTHQGNVCIKLDKPLQSLMPAKLLQNLPLDYMQLLKGLNFEEISACLSNSKTALLAEYDTQLDERLNRTDQFVNQPPIPKKQRKIYTIISSDMTSDSENEPNAQPVNILEIPPIVLSGKRLYWQRMWEYEQIIAQYLIKKSKERVGVDQKAVSALLDPIFINDNQSNVGTKNSIDRQKLAAIIAMTSNLAIISGGPGTGKTTTVARVLLALLRMSGTDNKQRLTIKLAAPTGKAAARLTESLLQAQQRLTMTEAESIALSLEAVTIHRLLGANGQTFRVNQDNLLEADILVIDEASMIDLSLMSKLIAALKPSTKLILLGDKDQLSSVEPGRVLGDICRFARLEYRNERASELANLLNVKPELLTATDDNLVHPLSDVICLLTRSRRFDDQSLIGQVAKAINEQNIARVKDFFKTHQQINDEQISAVEDQKNTSKLVFNPWNLPAAPLNSTYQQYQHLLTEAVSGYKNYLLKVREFREFFYLNDINKIENLEQQILVKVTDILEAFNNFRILTSIRNGIFGVSGLNQQIEDVLVNANLLRKQKTNHYEGRPIMISENDSALKLFNGDIGVTLYDPITQQLRAYFIDPKGQLRIISPARLPPHETAFSMTVHKSQGSEFEHTLLVLSPEINPTLTKELFYTAVTRAVTHLTIFANLDVIEYAYSNPTPRNSGLVEQLQIRAAV